MKAEFLCSMKNSSSVREIQLNFLPNLVIDLKNEKKIKWIEPCFLPIVWIQVEYFNKNFLREIPFGSSVSQVGYYSRGRGSFWWYFTCERLLGLL